MIEQQGSKVVLPKSYWEELEKCREELERLAGLFPDAPQPEDAVTRIQAEVVELRTKLEKTIEAARHKLAAAAQNETSSRLHAESLKEQIEKMTTVHADEMRRMGYDLETLRKTVNNMEQEINELREQNDSQDRMFEAENRVYPKKYDDVLVPREWINKLALQLEYDADKAGQKHGQGAASPCYDAASVANIASVLRQMGSDYKVPYYNHYTGDSAGNYDRYNKFQNP